MERGVREESLISRPLLVAVVDDDESVRESLPDLLGELGFVAHAFASAEEFLTSDVVNQTQCLLLDIAMPGMSGPALQYELQRRGKKFPIVFATAHREAGERILMGGVGCLFKPLSTGVLPRPAT